MQPALNSERESVSRRGMPDDSKTKIACHACRLRKVKCSREFPRCSTCRNCGQGCVYPSTTLKPGPKPGSVHKRRCLGPNIQGASPEAHFKAAPSEVLKKDSLANPTPSGIAYEDEDLRCSRQMHTVSELCHPSNETLSPNAAGEGSLPQENASAGENGLVTACKALGVSEDSMKQMLVQEKAQK